MQNRRVAEEHVVKKALLLGLGAMLVVCSLGCGDDGGSSSASGGSGATAGSGGAGASAGGGAAGGDGGAAGSPVADWCQTGDSVLAQVASQIQPRRWARLPDNAGLDALEMDVSLLYWNDSAVWDATHRRVQWVGGPGTCCADPAVYKMLTYDVVTDTWTIADTPFVGGGHAYDGNAMEPSTSDHFFALFHDRRVKRWDGSSWDELPADIPWSAQPSVGLAWFQDLQAGAGALVYVNGFGQVAWFDGTSWTALADAEAAPWGAYNTFVEYNPAHRVMWMGGGVDAERVHYVMDESFGFTKLADAPLALGNGSALHSCDPVSGMHIVTDLDDETWWELDLTADGWSQIEDMQDPPPFAGGSFFHVPIPDCGVILYFRHFHDERDVYLYRH